MKIKHILFAAIIAILLIASLTIQADNNAGSAAAAAAGSAASGSTESASIPTDNTSTDNNPPPIDPVKAANYPYTKNNFNKEGSVSFGENQALAVPSWLLILVLIIFLSGVAWIIHKIFHSQGAKERKRLDKLAQKEAKHSKKGSKKN